MARRFKSKTIYIFLWLLTVVCLVSSCTESNLTDLSNKPSLDIETEATPDSTENDPNKAEGSISLGLYGLDTLNPLTTKNLSVLKIKITFRFAMCYNLRRIKIWRYL